MKKAITIFTLLCFWATNIMGSGPVFAQLASPSGGEIRLPAPGTMVHLSPPENPPVLKGVILDPSNPFKFDFILDKGDSRYPTPTRGHVPRPQAGYVSPSRLPSKEGLNVKAPQGNNQNDDQDLRTESSKLVKYFLASITTPENDLWVNLSPYEKNRIIPESFGQTDMGRDLLGEDYILKQITASLIYPEDKIGKQFWKRIYEEAAKKFGTTNVPVNTFNKVWIVPDHAKVYEHGNTAFVVKARLKVMLEQDYLALQKHADVRNDVASVGANIIREIVIPQLEREVNEGQNFATLRQVYYSLILAVWFKKRMKDSILGRKYMDQNKISNLSSPNASVGDPEHIYQQYLKAFKKGVFNYIKEEPNPMTQEMVPRKYFSGGWVGRLDTRNTEFSQAMTTPEKNALDQGDYAQVSVNLDNADSAMTTPKAGLEPFTIIDGWDDSWFDVVWKGIKFEVDRKIDELDRHILIFKSPDGFKSQVYVAPIPRLGSLAIRGIEVNPYLRRQGMSRFMVNVLLNRWTAVEYSHPDLRNVILLKVLRDDFKFNPVNASARPNAYYLDGKAYISEENFSKFLKDANGDFKINVNEDIRGQYVVTDPKRLAALDSNPRATKLYLGELMSRDLAMQSGTGSEVRQTQIYFNYVQDLLYHLELSEKWYHATGLLIASMKAGLIAKDDPRFDKYLENLGSKSKSWVIYARYIMDAMKAGDFAQSSGMGEVSQIELTAARSEIKDIVKTRRWPSAIGKETVRSLAALDNAARLGQRVFQQYMELMRNPLLFASLVQQETEIKRLFPGYEIVSLKPIGDYKTAYVLKKGTEQFVIRVYHKNPDIAAINALLNESEADIADEINDNRLTAEIQKVDGHLALDRLERVVPFNVVFDRVSMSADNELRTELEHAWDTPWFTSSGAQNIGFVVRRDANGSLSAYLVVFDLKHFYRKTANTLPVRFDLDRLRPYIQEVIPKDLSLIRPAGPFRTDQAMKAAAQLSTGPGGIDLTANRMKLEVESDKAAVSRPMDLKALENIEIKGLYIKDIEIKPLNNLPELLGVSSD